MVEARVVETSGGMGALQWTARYYTRCAARSPALSPRTSLPPRAGRLADRSQRVLLASAVLGALSIGLVLPRGTTARRDDDKDPKDCDQYTAHGVMTHGQARWSRPGRLVSASDIP